MTDVSGFTFIKNGLTLGYPILESVKSIEPLCDEIIINVGFDDKELTKDDGTWDFLNSHFSHSKFKFLKSYWDPSLTKQGLILSQQTNIALEACRGKICQYIQGDEAIHEKDFPAIHDAYIEMMRNPNIEGLVFKYTHFYGNVDIVKHTRNIYRREVRTVRNDIGVVSHLDAQGFKKNGTDKLNCIQIPASIYHYGWARQEQLMAKKTEAFEKLYHGQDHQIEEYKYDRIWGLKKFSGTHPRVMEEWISKNRNEIDFWSLPMRFEWKNIGLAISDAVESATGYRMGEYKNYRLI
ncbi:MAG: hypothetical protein CME70_20965 [Halobacteriovorax sp.]|nr:hypothetical protein [Halobacteriovorax sp.]|tara:strand:+ start:47900 stop:48781 length:882 start_codon:yes stop_codon:yes gene_type:complete